MPLEWHAHPWVWFQQQFFSLPICVNTMEDRGVCNYRDGGGGGDDFIALSARKSSYATGRATFFVRTICFKPSATGSSSILSVLISQ